MEDGGKGKKRLELDWDTLLENDDGDPLSLVVVKRGNGNELKNSAEEEMGGGDDERAKFSSMSDCEVEGYVKRQQIILDNMSLNLPDKGEKIRITIKLAKAELNRRRQRQDHGDDDENEKSTQSRDSNCCDASDCEPGSPCHESMQSSFASSFRRKMAEDHQDRNYNNASAKKLSTIHPCHYGKLQDNKQFEQRKKQKCDVPSRKNCSKFSGNAFIKDDSREGRSPACDIHENDLHHFSSKRRKASRVNSSIISKPISTVVLLDEDESQHKETIMQPEQIDDSLKNAKIYYPSRDDPESVELYYSDIACLAPEAYLSSAVMNFYIRYLQQKKSDVEGVRCDYHVFNTYFYSKLKEAVPRKGGNEILFSKFRRWWKGVNIFEKAYILLPINEDLHWSLVIICNPDKEVEFGPIILHLDSLGLHFSKSIFSNIRSFLEEEWKCMNHGDAPSTVPIADKIWRGLPREVSEKKIMVPQQNNDYDCGVFVLYFMERFFQDAPKRLKREDLARFGKQWFRPEEASGLRRKIRGLLLEEFRNLLQDKIISNS